MSERWKDWSSHGWPVSFSAVSPRCLSERYYGQIIDLPGMGAQGRTISEVLERIDAILPEYLKFLREKGVEIPEPSKPHGFACESFGFREPPDDDQ
jgi:predicted RNase H-like HicB family nuclease